MAAEGEEAAADPILSSDEEPGLEGLEGLEGLGDPEYGEEGLDDADLPADDIGDLPPLNVPPKKEEKKGPQITRLSMVEYMTEREWWRTSQWSWIFTMCLWLTFVMIMYLHNSTQASFKVHDAIKAHVTRIVASPVLSGLSVYTPETSPSACQCACSAKFTPIWPCSQDMPNSILPHEQATAGTSVEDLSFLGLMPPQDAARLVKVSMAEPGGMYQPPPMSWDDIEDGEDAVIWTVHGLMPDLWGSVGGIAAVRPGVVLRRNMVIGGIRLRQTRTVLACLSFSSSPAWVAALPPPVHIVDFQALSARHQ